MKNLLYFLLLLPYTLFAQDTVRLTKNRTILYELVIQKPKPDTVVIRDTVYVPVAQKQDTVMRMLYVDNFSKILGTSEELVLKQYAKDLKFNGFAYYDLSAVLGNTSLYPRLQAFISDCRTNWGIIYHEATRGTGGSTSQVASYNRACSNVNQRISSLNLEYEYWNQPDLSAAWRLDSSYLTQMKSIGLTAGISDIRQYFGWFVPDSLRRRVVNEINRSLTQLPLHYYRTKVEASYGKYRTDSLERLSTPTNIMPIFSAEPDFMQNLYKQISPDSAYAEFVRLIKPYNYRKVRVTGYYVFCYSFLKVAIPPKPSSLRSSLPPAVIPFENKTTESHLKTAEER